MLKTNKKKRGQQKDILSMMGYDAGEDENDADEGDLADELAMILGESAKPTSKIIQNEPTQPQLLEWSAIQEQVSSSLRDEEVSDNDADVTEEDEHLFMGELSDLLEDESNTLKVDEPRRLPSPVPPSDSVDILTLLKSRRRMYEIGIEESRTDSTNTRARRLQRGLKQLDTLIRAAKQGRSVKENDIPPEIVLKKASSSNDTPPILKAECEKNTQQTGHMDTQPPILVQGNVVDAELSKNIDVIQQPPNVSNDVAGSSRKTIAAIPAAVDLEHVVQDTTESVKRDVQILEKRKLEYKHAAIQAKRSGNKEEALKYFRILKQFETVMNGVKMGKALDLSTLPPPMPNTAIGSDKQHQETQKQDQSVAVPVRPSKSESYSPTAPERDSPSKPQTVLEALEQRMKKYQQTADEATKEGNGGKSRRMLRIVKQYQAAIKTLKAGRPVNFDELPTPPGFPPIPGEAAKSEENLMERASQLLHEKDEDHSEPQTLKVTPPPGQRSPRSPSPAKASRTQITANPGVQQQPSQPQTLNVPQGAKAKPPTAYESQISFLTNRQAAFKQAALYAKKKGDKAAALDYLRKMKGFDEMIEAAKSGIKVNITNVPQPPMIPNTEISAFQPEIEDLLARKSSNAEDDTKLYGRLLEILMEQIKKAREYAMEMTHCGDFSSAEMCDKLAVQSQSDYDYVKSCQRHKDIPPRFYNEEREFKSLQINPNIGSNEIELNILQCIGVGASLKDNKSFVEWEMPFPHDNPAKGQTNECKPSNNPRYDSTFRLPFNRKSRSNQRAIKSKFLKLSLFTKGGFLKSSRVIGTCNVKLSHLENNCKLHSIEKLTEGRNSVGEIELKVNLRTPLVDESSKSVKEKWLFVKQSKPADQRPPTKPGSVSVPRKSTSTTKSAPVPRSGSPTVNISSIEANGIELKIIKTKIEDCRMRQRPVPKSLIADVRRIQNEIRTTRDFIQSGGDVAKKEYYACLTKQYQHLEREMQHYHKEGKSEQMSTARKKREVISAELSKLKSQ